jgi:hypothetical protein
LTFSWRRRAWRKASIGWAAGFPAGDRWGCGTLRGDERPVDVAAGGFVRWRGGSGVDPGAELGDCFGFQRGLFVRHPVEVRMRACHGEDEGAACGVAGDHGGAGVTPAQGGRGGVELAARRTSIAPIRGF